MAAAAHTTTAALVRSEAATPEATAHVAQLKKCHTPAGEEAPCTGKVGEFTLGNPHGVPTTCLAVDGTRHELFNSTSMGSQFDFARSSARTPHVGPQYV